MSNTKTALVTGGSRGIGFGITTKLLEAGYRVAVNGVRGAKDVQAPLAELKALGDVIYCQGDIGTGAGRESILQMVRDYWGEIHVLVNNAGVAPKTRKDILEVNEEDYDHVMDINLKGAFFLTQAVSQSMVDSKNKNESFEGCIINVSSISAEVVSINRAEYCLSKAGMSMLTQLMAVRLAEVDIPVYEVRPGVIQTDMTAVVTEKYERLIAEGLTLDKRMGTPEDIGRIVASLVRGDMPYSTGQVLTPDGGLMIRRL